MLQQLHYPISLQVHLMGPPLPPCEKDRLTTVDALGRLEAPPDPELQTILKLVRSVFEVSTTMSKAAYILAKQLNTSGGNPATQVFHTSSSGQVPVSLCSCGGTSLRPC
jgi:hypothetical protein